MKRQKILIIVLLSLFILLLVGYFLIIRPMTETPEETDEAPPETEAGEALGNGDRFFLFGSLSRSDIAQIEVENEYGTFALYQAAENEFEIRGYDSVPYDETLFASLVNVSAYTLSKTKVGSNLSDEKIAEYGLDVPVARWSVTSTGGDKYTVLVGDRLLTGGGYYCMLEGRRSVYVLGTEVADTILVPIENYVTPVLTTGISQENYYEVNNFTVYKDGEMLLRIRLKDKEDQNNPDALAENIMDYPTAYSPDANMYYEIIFSYLELRADSCYKLGATAEDFAAVGLDDPAHGITFEYEGQKFELYFSELTENGTYYVYSSLYPNVIGICSGENHTYLEYSLIDWIDPYVYQQYITNIQKLNISTDTVQAEFRLEHDVDDQNKPLLSVTTEGRALPEDYIPEFRDFYKSLVALAIQDYYAADEYATMTPEEMEVFAADPENAYMTFTATSLSGEETVYRFYPYSTRHSLVTIDGVGEFYVLTDLVKKIENDTIRVLNGEEIEEFGKS